MNVENKNCDKMQDKFNIDGQNLSEMTLYLHLLNCNVIPLKPFFKTISVSFTKQVMRNLKLKETIILHF